MKKNKIMMLVLLLSLTMTVAACGKQAVSENVNNANPTESNKEINLRLWGASDDAELLQIIADNFVEQHKSEATITISIDYHSESECKDYILDDIKNAPDVFTFVDDQLASFAAGASIKPVEYNLTDVTSRNSEASVSAASLNGTLYAYPLTADNGYFLYYNKEYFNEGDLGSMDSILSVAAANEKKVTMDISSGWYFYALFGNTGMSVGLNDDGITNYCNWNSTEGDIKGVDVCNAIMNFATNEGFLNGGDGSLVDGAKDGSVIAGVSGVWLATQLKEIWGNNLGAVKLPTYTVNGKQIQMSSYAGYKMVGVNAYSENHEWAEKLADFITNEENQTLRFKLREQGPSNISAASSPEVAASPAIQALIAQSEFSSLQRIGSAYWGPVGSLGYLLATGNPDGKDLQEVLDQTVTNVTAAN